MLKGTHGPALLAAVSLGVAFLIKVTFVRWMSK